MKNKKILISSLVSVCLTLVLGLGLLFAGMFSKEEVKYTGRDDVYVNMIWDDEGYNDNGAMVYESKLHIEHSNKHTIFNKSNKDDVEKVYNDVMEQLVSDTQKQADTLVVASPYDQKLWNISINQYHNTLADDASAGLLAEGTNSNFGDCFTTTDMDKFLQKQDAKTSLDGTIYGTTTKSTGETSVDLSPIENVVYDYINTNTTTLNFTSEIIELVFGSLLIISSVIGGTILMILLKKNK